MKITKAVLDPRLIISMNIFLTYRHFRFALLWEMGLLTGLRISDLLSLRVKDIKPVMEVVEKKTKKLKRIELNDEVLQDARVVISRCKLAPGEFIFFSHEKRKHKPMSRQWAHRVIALTAKKIGLESIGAHSMRKIYACMLYSRTGQIEAVQKALNHSKPEITLAYIQDFLEQSKS